MSSKEKIHRREIFRELTPVYEYMPPDGGWGIVITLATSFLFIFTIVPLAAFGMIFGGFLASVGDETSGTALVNGMLGTVMNFTGLAANQLLQRMSCRKVGFLGAFLFFVGTFSTIFATNLTYLIISMGVFEGLGLGLMMPACFTMLNSYFDKRKNLMMNLNQVLVVACTIAWPAVNKVLMEEFGFRGTLAIVSGLSLNCFLAMATLQPVKWHMVKRKLVREEVIGINSNRKNSLKGEVEEALLPEANLVETKTGSYLIAKPRPSIISLGSFGVSVGSNMHQVGKGKDEDLSTWQALVKTLDLGLFSDPKYVNITMGLSLSLMADLTFLSLMPLLLTGFGYGLTELTQLMTIYFATDLISRIFLTFLAAFCNYRNRYVFLIGTIMSMLFRTAFIFNTNSYVWIASMCACMGFFRCFIQTPLPIVIAEQYSHRFTTAFSLYMVVCGVVSLIFGPLIGVVKHFTQSDIMVVHFLSGANLVCTVCWGVELLWTKICGKKNEQSS